MSTFYLHHKWEAYDGFNHHEVEEVKASTLKEAMLKYNKERHLKLKKLDAPEAVLKAINDGIDKINASNPQLVNGILELDTEIDTMYWSDKGCK